jgi:hypothetical protein
MKADMLQEKADALSEEAKRILHSKFKIPEGVSDNGLNRLVDCIVGAAMLEIVALQQTALQQSLEK